MHCAKVKALVITHRKNFENRMIFERVAYIWKETVYMSSQLLNIRSEHTLMIEFVPILQLSVTKFFFKT